MANHAPMQPPIYGREREQAQLQQLLDAALDGHGSLVLISGEAGIGKTTLVNDLIASARDRNCLVLTGGCYDLTTTPPYGPWSEAIRGYQPEEGQPPVPDWFGNPEELEKVGSQTALFEEARRFFASVAEYQPLIIVLEDLHWSDGASLEALRYLARTLPETAILLVISFRDDELTRRHDLYQLLPLLVRESRAQRIHLNRIDHDNIRELIASRYELDGADLERLVTHVAERSEGNPFFLGEILQGLEEEQALRLSDGVWQLDDLDHVQVPLLLRQVLDQRLTSLTPETLGALQVAAVIGQIVALDLWQQVTGLDANSFDQLIAEALEARIFDKAPTPDALAFRHALLRETLYERLILNRRREFHRQVGETLIELVNRDPDEVAHHFDQASDRRAIEWLLKAGVRAEDSYAWDQAADRYEQAERFMEAEPQSAQARGWLLVKIGHLLRYTDKERSLAHLDAAEQLAAQINDPIMTADSRRFQGLILCFQGRVGDGVAKMANAVDLLDNASEEEKEQAREAQTSLFVENGLKSTFSLGALPSINMAIPLYALWLKEAGRYDDAQEMAERFVRAVAEASADAFFPDGLCRDAFATLADSADALGRPNEAATWRKRAIQAYEAIGHHALVANTYSHALEHLVTYATDRIAERRRVAVAAVAAAERAGGAWMSQDRSARQHGVLLDVIEGRWNEASDLAVGSLPQQSGAEKGVRSLVLRTLGREREDLQSMARDHIGEVLPNGLSTEPGETYFDLAVAAQRLAAALLLDEGNIEEARAWIGTHDQWLDWSGAVRGRAEGQLLWSRYFHLSGESEKAQQHAVQALDHAADPRQPLALIAAHRLLGELDTELERFDEADDHLQAALELAQRCEAVYERALTLLALAELAVAREDPQEANHQLREARAICQDLGAKRSLARADQIEARIRRHSTEHPAGLSDREVEVLEQAATGMTNAEIGEALYISPRTVAQHLRSVYNKLGVNSRTAAVARWAELTQEAKRDSANG